MVKVLFIILSILLGLCSYSQKLMLNRDYLKAERLFSKAKYDEALPILKALDSSYNEPDLNYLIGVSLKELKQNEEEAIPYLEKYVSQSDSIDQAHFYLAELYHWNYQFDEAINMYQRFENIALNKTKDSSLCTLIQGIVAKRIAECNYGKLAVDSPRKVVIENLGDKVNSPFPEYAPVISKDEKQLYFTARKDNSTGHKKDKDNEYFEDIYFTELIEGSLFDEQRLDTLTKNGGFITLVTDMKYSDPVHMWSSVNSKKHDGAIQLSNDEDSLYFYRDFDIWVAPVSDTLKEIKPHRFDAANTSAYEPSVYFSYDGRTMFVSSEREGGYGGLDLYVSNLDSSNNWSPLINLGPKINTKYDEDAPYIDPDGKTIYFASKGHSSMGGYDVFKTVNDPVNGWSDIENMGYPVNTPGDDIYYVMTPRYNRAYYSSNNLQGYGGMDIYRLTFADERHSTAELKGLVLEGDNYLPAKSKLTMYNSDSTVFSSFNSDTTTGKYLVLLGHGKSYDMLVETEGFLPYHKKFKIPEQREYYQLYQEIHHIFLYDNYGNKIGQQIVVFNSFDGVSENDTSLMLYDSRTRKEYERISQMRNGDKVEVYTDVHFYMSKDSLAKLLESDSTLKYHFPENTTFSFLDNDSLEINLSENYKDVSANFVKDILNRKKVFLNKVESVEDLETAIGRDSLKEAPIIILHFDFDKSKILNEEKNKLDLFAQYLKNNESVSIKILGHTDSKGSNLYNNKLSYLRAERVKKYLVSVGIEKNRLSVEGMGEKQPIVSNTNPDGTDNQEGRRLNRRVEFIIIQ